MLFSQRCAHLTPTKELIVNNANYINKHNLIDQGSLNNIYCSRLKSTSYDVISPLGIEPTTVLTRQLFLFTESTIQSILEHEMKTRNASMGTWNFKKPNLYQVA